MTEAASSDRPGQRFQNFVAMLERMFAHHDGVGISSPLRLRDKDTGQLREHDVVITRATHHGPNLTAIECRDHSRKVGVPEIEAFAKKCEKTGIHRGIVVAANGFTNTARIKAKALNLTCMELAEAEAFEWIGAVTIIGQFYQFTKIEIFVSTMKEGGRKIVYPHTVYDGDGTPYLGEGAQDFIMSELPPKALTATNGVPLTGKVVAPAEAFYVIDAVGERFRVKDITFIYALEIEISTKPVTLHNYAGEDTAMEIASGQITFPGGQATLALVKTADGMMGHLLSTGASSHRVCIGDPAEGGLWRGGDPLVRNPIKGA